VPSTNSSPSCSAPEPCGLLERASRSLRTKAAARGWNGPDPAGTGRRPEEKGHPPAHSEIMARAVYAFRADVEIAAIAAALSSR
jgi:hypothetical protein